MKKKNQHPIPEPKVYEPQEPDQYWPTVEAYFTELFTKQPARDEVKIIADILRTDLNAWSDKNHYLDRLKIVLYGKGYRPDDGYYNFKREDFAIGQEAVSV